MGDILSAFDAAYRAIDAAVDNFRRQEKTVRDDILEQSIDGAGEIAKFLKSCDQDLSKTIDKLLKIDEAKTAEIVKLAKSIKATTILYGNRLQKIQHVNARGLVEQSLAGKLEVMQEASSKIISKNARDSKTSETLKSAQKEWNHNKSKIVDAYKKNLAEVSRKSVKESIARLDESLKFLDVKKLEQAVIAFKQLERAEGEKKKKLASLLLRLFKEHQTRATKFSSMEGGGALFFDQYAELSRAMRKTIDHLTEVAAD